MLRRFNLMAMVIITVLLFHSGFTNASASRFFDMQNGTVYDANLNILWLQNVNCIARSYWASAMSASGALHSGQCSLSDGSVAGDWSLPNISQLTDIAANRTSIFYNVQSSSTYWSSTDWINYSGNAYAIGMYANKTLLY